jgi:N-methylhydantoinase A
MAADVGGTFTDITCLSPSGVLGTRKVPSTPHDYAVAIVRGITELAAELGIAHAEISEVLHASTIATNVILENRGARTALITTRGFRDVLELRRIRVPRLYEPLYQKPAPLVPRRHRYEITERMGPKGEVVQPLALDEVHALAAELAASPVEAVAICFLHSYANSAHEDQVATIMRAALPDAFISASAEILPEIREYERTSTTVINAYVGPMVARYLWSLKSALVAHGITGRLMMMHSSGGTLDVDRVIAKPAQVVESGPAAGVVGAAMQGRDAGYRDIITFDMGGTTAKASLVEDGRVVKTDEYEVGGGMSLSSRLVKGGGYALKLPVIDISEVGAGGGSIVWLDAAGGLKVGPHSAGASPGPACYDAGGTEPTVTDANVVLGYNNRDSLAGGTVKIDAAKAHAALETKIATALGCSVLDAAFGVHRLANIAMMRAVKSVSTYRGRDPRDFTLFAFGGNGGIHAAALARELGMARVIVPPAAGVFSAVGLLLADLEVSRSVAFARSLSGTPMAEILTVFAALDDQVAADIGSSPDLRIAWSAQLRYAGQAFELPVELVKGPWAEDYPAEIRAAFEREHQRIYGHVQRAGEVQFVAVRVTGTIPQPPRDGPIRKAAVAPLAEATRSVYFGAEIGSLVTRVIGRGGLSAESRQGPLIVEEYEGTTVVPPDATAALDGFNNIVITLARASS